jgi:hypothetical protein
MQLDSHNMVILVLQKKSENWLLYRVTIYGKETPQALS